MQVALLNTGGTIASTGGDGGAEPTRTGADLVEAVPELADYADLDVEQVVQELSFQLDAETLETIGRRVRDRLADEAVDAVVVTHGTDTVEETAYYLDVALQPSKPVVLTGAQRRPDEVSPDGPANLLAAVRAARAFADRAAGGTYVAFAGEVHAARYARKVDASALDAFASPGPGPVAVTTRAGVRVFREPRSESAHVPTLSLDPDVAMVKSAAGVTGESMQAALDAGVDGVVLEGTGLGNVTRELGDLTGEALSAGVPVVVTSRTLAGATAPVYGGPGGGATLRRHGAIFGDDLPAGKARLKLALALAHEGTLAGARAAFEGDGFR